MLPLPGFMHCLLSFETWTNFISYVLHQIFIVYAMILPILNNDIS